MSTSVEHRSPNFSPDSDPKHSPNFSRSDGKHSPRNSDVMADSPAAATHTSMSIASSLPSSSGTSTSSRDAATSPLNLSADLTEPTTFSTSLTPSPLRSSATAFALAPATVSSTSNPSSVPWRQPSLAEEQHGYSNPLSTGHTGAGTKRNLDVNQERQVEMKELTPGDHSSFWRPSQSSCYSTNNYFSTEQERSPDVDQSVVLPSPSAPLDHPFSPSTRVVDSESVGQPVEAHENSDPSCSQATDEGESEQEEIPDVYTGLTNLVRRSIGPNTQRYVAETIRPQAGVVYSGWLKLREGKTFKNWRHRWFVAYSNRGLRYFSDNTAEKCLGAIDLTTVEAVLAVDKLAGRDVQRSFEVITAKQKWHLIANSDEDRNMWFSVMAQPSATTNPQASQSAEANSSSPPVASLSRGENTVESAMGAPQDESFGSPQTNLSPPSPSSYVPPPPSTAGSASMYDEMDDESVNTCDQVDNMRPPEIIHSGWLRIREGKIRKKWRNRWFVVYSNGGMLYFSDRQAQRCLGVIDLCTVDALLPTEAILVYGKPTSFAMLIEKKTWAMAANSPEDREQWMSVLRAGSRGELHESQSTEDSLDLFDVVGALSWALMDIVDVSYGMYLPEDLAREISEFMYCSTDWVFRTTGEGKKCIAVMGEVSGKTEMIQRWSGLPWESAVAPTNIESSEKFNVTEYPLKKVFIKDQWRPSTMIEILDTSGEEDYYRSFLNQSDGWASKADGAMLVHNLTKPLANGECLAVFRDALLKEHGESFPMILVGNLCDLEYERRASFDECVSLANEWNIQYFEVSAKTKQGLFEAFDAIIRKTLKKPRAADIRKVASSPSSVAINELCDFHNSAASGVVDARAQFYGELRAIARAQPPKWRDHAGGNKRGMTSGCTIQ